MPYRQNLHGTHDEQAIHAGQTSMEFQRYAIYLPFLFGNQPLSEPLL